MPSKSKRITNKVTLAPNRSVIVITAQGLREIAPTEATAANVGQKAMGLLTVPAKWTLPFFVVFEEALASTTSSAQMEAWLLDAAHQTGVVQNRVIVRSNGITEGLSERGALKSQACAWTDVVKTIEVLRAETSVVASTPTHWIIQNEVVVYAKGQLSNERRVRYENRDWAVEIEPMNGRHAVQTSIAVRLWRARDSFLTEAPLVCGSALRISFALRQVGTWAVQDKRRFLFEWVWDGTAVHVVQMDVASTSQGEDPRGLLPAAVSQVSVSGLRHFVEATAEHKQRFRKLANARMYEELGYSMPPFFILEDAETIAGIIEGRPLPNTLLDDLRVLTERPLVLRTDGIGLPGDKREMLPRSEELRGVEPAAKWLAESFGPTIARLGLTVNRLVLIGHHFIPSVASAWAGAQPGRRWVRIEALWGIPESLYWHSHDTFEVDTERAELDAPATNRCEYPIRYRERFKGTFIAPDENGAWVHHETKPPHDWAPTIGSSQTICEIAHTTRRICERVGKPVQVMWFVENHPAATKHTALPWYHSESDDVDVPVRAPRKKIKTSQERRIQTERDWLLLKEAVTSGVRVERVTVEPFDPELVRNPSFAEELGAFAHEHHIVVVLAGGILAHAYHALRRAGASVECIDLYGAGEERVEYNKIVRDKIPPQISSRGESFDIVRLSGDALVLALRRKLVEEALEALDAPTGTDLIAELADVQEVINAIAGAVQVSTEQLEDERERKLKKRGGFDEGLMLVSTVSPYSIVRQQPPDDLIAAREKDGIRTVSDPALLPEKAIYKRPDHRKLGEMTEELLVVETELNHLGRLVESIDFELPPNVDARRYSSCIELSRTGGELRAAVRLQAKHRKGESAGQKAFDFDEGIPTREEPKT